jgi:RNA polymerase sigma-70 factor, ECF subfamily
MADDIRELRLVLLAQVGDREAYGQLLTSVQERLFRYLLGLLHDAALAEDVLQEVFVIVYQKLRWVRDPQLFRPWLYRLATREALRLSRRRRRRGEVPLEEHGGEVPAEAPPDRAFIRRLPELVQSLSPASRAVLLLHYTEELSLEEVADTLGLSLGTAKSRLAYGLASLRRRLGISTPNREGHGAEPGTTARRSQS